MKLITMLFAAGFILSIIIFFQWLSYKLSIKNEITITYKQFMALYEANPDSWTRSSIHDFACYDDNFLIYENRIPETNKSSCDKYNYICKAIYFDSWFSKVKAKVYFRKRMKKAKDEKILEEKAKLVKFWNNDVEIAYQKATETLEKAKKEYERIACQMEGENKCD